MAAATHAPLVLEIPAHCAERTAFEEHVYEVSLPPRRWDDDDERWNLLTNAYHLIEEHRAPRWPDERYRAALDALLVLVDNLPLAFNTDGEAYDQLDQLRAAVRASATIAENLDRVMNGV